MTKELIKVIFVCGYGVGSSAMSAMLVKKGLDKLGIPSEVEHTAAGEASSYSNWADIVAVNKKLINIVNVDSFPEQDIIEVENIMDGDGIAKQIKDIVEEKYPELIKGD
ncbi:MULTISPECIES: PTS sugar transporter subunit IIB [Aerococcus]|uniref:PTS sugar transporter IIB n=1 Tax=Aerococcus urinae TaxID=1376 RepID=A0A2I1L691_9LACT|nr:MULTISPECIES: PTS sugar transporter IIB [Aerococcus]KAA9219191.1 PTS sugar transporter IIB [Aerococcus loyolae]KAA9266676.1 PTS sugar transporter IIB [Aerococcus loyolae]MCY3067790.1 hypothetical protein [Aerococcus mictus]MCY3080310.1 hypothetical protein [Aerococcus mictus]MCY3084090.1 hypothetical protein [Aerococcus mictus]